VVYGLLAVLWWGGFLKNLLKCKNMNWDSLMDYGKYKFTRLREIPASYFIELKNSNSIRYESLKEFIESNFEELKSLGNESKGIVEPIEYVICDKYRYATEEEARKHLRQITKYKEQREYVKNKIPTRTYQCEICGFWHLTSKPDKYASL